MFFTSSKATTSPVAPREVIVRCGLVGVGSVGQSLLRIIKQKTQLLKDRHNIRILFVLMSDTSGTLVSHHGLDIDRALALKTGFGFESENYTDFDTASKHSLSQYKVSLSRDKKANATEKEFSQIWFYPSGTSQNCAELFLNESVLPAETFQNKFILFEASPVNMKTAEPGLSIAKNAMNRGAHIVLANKGPLAIAFQELQQLSKSKKVNLLYSATVCGGLPVINIGKHDLTVADFTEIRGVFNSTSNFILTEMAAGRSYEASLKEAQRRGIAETDPTLDVEGIDTANKLYILFSTIVDNTVALADVKTEGITTITKEKMEEAKSQGKVYKLVGSAVKREIQHEEGDSNDSNRWVLTVKPELLPKGDFLAMCDGWQMGVEFHSDIFGSMYHKVDEREPTPTAAAMLRDALNVWVQHSHSR